MLGKLLAARYKIIEVLGEGGFGRTYVAEDTQRPGRPKCVVKQFKPSNQNPNFLEVARRLFNTEAETLERLGQHDQIPRLLAYFEEEEEFYLVQEFIEGHPLSKELTAGKKHSEAYVIDLLENVLGILQYVHAEGVIHRDIKPSNLIRRKSDGKLVLIDFGAVKAIQSQMLAEPRDWVELTVGIGTHGYMPNEQLAGKPRFNSDIYALGIIAIKALTGMQPLQLQDSSKTNEIIWRDRATVSNRLADVIDKMARYDYSDRYQSVPEVLAALGQISSPTYITEIITSRISSFAQKARKPILGFGAIAIASLAIVLLVKSIAPSLLIPDLTPIKTPTNLDTAKERISFGTKILSFDQDNSLKKEGADLMKAGAYDKAVSVLEKARKLFPTDPEILIYLNNARIGNAKAYTIAAAVALGSSPATALEMLRGVAQAQDEINADGGINGIPLKVAIANDDNRAEVAENVARELVNNPEILGVVGHGISDTTLAAGKVYQSGELVAISPISSAVQLSELGGYIFRTMPSDRYTARALCNYMLNKLKKSKAVVFYNSNSVYSQSLKDEFKNALFYINSSKLIREFDLSRPDFNAKRSLEIAEKQGAEVIMLAVSGDASDPALQVVYMNRQRLKLLAGDGFYTPKTLEIGGKEAEGMVLAVPGHIIGNRGLEFSADALKLWGQEVNWRTALAYDSTGALIEAIRKNPTRKGVQRSLLAADFSIPGATGNVIFRATGDREAPVQLMIVTPIATGKPENGYKFMPLQQ